LAQYLVKGIAAADAEMISEAEGMLATLADDIAEHGGQPISVEPLPSPAAEAGPAAPGSAPPSPASDGRVSVSPVSVSPVSVSPVSAELIAAPANTDVSEPMPAVHVMPIPADEDMANAPAPAAADAPATADAPGTADADGADDAEGGPDAQDGADAEDRPRATEAGTQPEPLSADDTSTTAITIVDAKAP
jgi:hypothetical protein